jgi:hypothetical protein
MTDKGINRIIPAPTGFDDAVKAKAAQAERGWDAATGLITFLGAGGAAALAAGAAIPPIAPFAAAVAAGSFYFKLRAKWAREDPPRSDFDTVTDVRTPPLDLMPLMPPGDIPPGAAVVSLLYAAGASVEATVLAVERAAGASMASQEGEDEGAALALAARRREALDHARLSASLTAGLHSAAVDIGPFLQQNMRPPRARAAGKAAAGPAAPRRSRIIEMLDDAALGHVIAAGIDARILEVDTWHEEQPEDMRLSVVLAEAGASAEVFGAALARWAQENSFGGPGSR